MVTVKELQERLSQHPDDSRVRAYEGEVTGIVVEDQDGNELEFIPTNDT